MNQEPHAPAPAPRSAHAIHILPRDWPSLARVLTPGVERIDPLDPATQLLMIVPDVESTVASVAGAFTELGPQGIDVLPATSAARATRLLRSDPARAIAGPPWVLRALLGSSVLRLDTVRTIVLAWVEEVIEEGGEALGDLEAVVAEAPKDAARILVARELSPAVEKFAERHLHRARRLGPIGAGAPTAVSVSYVATSSAARPGALRLVLDELDPPSAVVVTRTPESETDARATVRQLGYRRADDVVQVTRGVVPANTNTVVLYDPPLDAESLEAIARAHPARIVVLVNATDIASLRRLTGNRAQPLVVAEPHGRSRRDDELLRRELRQVLQGRFGTREIAAIEPLLAEYDAAEIAGALVRLLEREREPSPGQRDTRPPRREERPSGRDSRPPRREEQPSRRDSRPPRRDDRTARGESRPPRRDDRGRRP